MGKMFVISDFGGFSPLLQIYIFKERLD